MVLVYVCSNPNSVKRIGSEKNTGDPDISGQVWEAASSTNYFRGEIAEFENSRYRVAVNGVILRSEVSFKDSKFKLIYLILFFDYI